MSLWQTFVICSGTPALRTLTRTVFACKMATVSDASRFPVGLRSGTINTWLLISMTTRGQRSALGVLENMVQPLVWSEWDVARALLRKKHAQDTDSDGTWLPALVASKGVAAVALELQDGLAAYREKVRPARLKWAWLVDKPHWDGMVLSFGGQMWTFRQQNGPVNQLLEELENTKWRYPVLLTHLTRQQVTDAARLIRKKTRGYIDWHATKKKEFSWSLPKKKQ